MQSTFKVACLAALSLVLTGFSGVQAQPSAAQHVQHATVQHHVPILLADDGGKPGMGGG
jgi:hypothetical protein